LFYLWFSIVAKGFSLVLATLYFSSSPPSIVQKIILAKNGQKEFFRAGKTSARY
jgi:hypothetical protein